MARSINFVAAIMMAALITGCASLSNGQLSAVKSFSNSCDSFARYPSKLFVELSDIRKERGFFYAATFDSPDNRIAELNAITDAHTKELAIAKKCDVATELLFKYQRGLKRLCSDSRWEESGRVVRQTGRGIDSLIKKFNSLEITKAIPMGIGKSLGKAVGYGTELFKKRAQSRAVKRYVKEGDTLVKVLVAGIAEILSSSDIMELIKNEQVGVEQNYRAYLISGKGRGWEMMSDKEYSELRLRALSLSKSRALISSSIKRLGNAHAKIASEMQKKRRIKELYKELEEFESEVKSLKKFIDGYSKK